MEPAGDTHTSDNDDLSMDTLTNDVIGLIHALYADVTPMPPVILVGHR